MNQENAPTDLPADEDIFAVEVPISQKALLCVKLIKSYPAQQYFTLCFVSNAGGGGGQEAPPFILLAAIETSATLVALSPHH